MHHFSSVPLKGSTNWGCFDSGQWEGSDEAGRRVSAKEAESMSMEGFSAPVHHIARQQAVKLQQVVAMDVLRVT